MSTFVHAVLVAALAVLAACTPSPAADQAADFDRQFIDMMVPHHLGAVEMAIIAQQRTQRPEIKQLAEAIIRDQNREISQMRDWRKAWFGSDQTPSLERMPMVPGMGGEHAAHDAGTMDMAADVAALRSAAEPFDRAFIDAMIPHHQSAIEAARAAESRARRPEIKQLAKTITTEQQREIDQMQQWRQAWFGSGR